MIPIQYSREVAAARQSGAALVALESTIITHGMPFPQNVETARLVEDDVRAAGAVPATIAVLDGLLHVGL
ncbi:MAG: pseudouridine-5'-phosphate glycosidase, partial [Paracoccaceae bacterium]|nr:pseudouridine-5'-phosphate glycosidase [Paracoccaceae bacterium]